MAMEAWLVLAPYMVAEPAITPPESLPEPPAIFQQDVTVEKIDDTLTVLWRKKQILPKEHAVIFTGGVTAKYGPTTLRAETLKLWLSETDQRGLAQGAVHIDDPDGSGDAETLEFDWKKRTGLGKGVKIVANGVGEIRAETLDIGPEQWVFTNAYASPQQGGKPVVSVRSPRVVYRPGQSGTAKPAILQLFGKEIIRLPSYRFGQKSEEGLMRIPSVSYNRGFGVAWNGSYFADDRSLVSGGFRARTGQSTGLQIMATRSFLPRGEEGVNAPPFNDFSERFSHGWFDTIYSQTPSDERAVASQRRSSFSIGTEFNQYSPARRVDEQYSRPIFAVLEYGAPLGQFGFYSALRAETVRESAEDIRQRGSLRISALAPKVQIARGLNTHLRVDTQGWMSDRPYMWAQAQIGVIYEPNDRLRFGLARVVAEDFGRPLFESDRLYSLGGWQFRADANFGSTKLSYIGKYDFERRKWYDNEISFAQKAGIFEPYVGFREFPRSLNFGVRLKTDDLFDRLKRRLERRRR